MDNPIVIAVLVVAVIGLLCAVMLTVASKFMAVEYLRNPDKNGDVGVCRANDRDFIFPRFPFQCDFRINVCFGIVRQAGFHALPEAFLQAGLKIPAEKCISEGQEKEYQKNAVKNVQA